MLRLIAVVGALWVPGIALAVDAVPSGPELMGALVGQEDQAAATSVRLVVLLTVMSVLPGLLLVMTPFVRFIIVFSLLRQALGLQSSPPNQVLVGLSLALSMMVMQDPLTTVQQTALDPYLAGELSTTEALTNGLAPMRQFMLAHVGEEELWTCMRIARVPGVDGDAAIDPASVGTPVVMTAFVLSELKNAFVIGVQVYIPFLVVDVIVASVLLGMGMMMLPPVVISLPFKLMVFVLMDGWQLLVTGLVGGYH